MKESAEGGGGGSTVPAQTHEPPVHVRFQLLLRYVSALEQSKQVLGLVVRGWGWWRRGTNRKTGGGETNES